jgi:hypothetical protein
MVRVYFEQHFYDGTHVHDLGRREVMAIPISPGGESRAK